MNHISVEMDETRFRSAVCSLLDANEQCLKRTGYKLFNHRFQAEQFLSNDFPRSSISAMATANSHAHLDNVEHFTRVRHVLLYKLDFHACIQRQRDLDWRATQLFTITVVFVFSSVRCRIECQEENKTCLLVVLTTICHYKFVKQSR